MADLSKIRKNGVDYDIKDATARAAIEELKQNGTGGNVDLTGYVQSVNGQTPDENGNVVIETNAPTDEQVGTAVSAYLDAHPEATTTVQDGSITEAKLAEDLKKSIRGGSMPNVVLMGDSVTDENEPRSVWAGELKKYLTFTSLTNYARGAATWTFKDNTEYTNVRAEVGANNVIWNQYNRMVSDIENNVIPVPNVVMIFAGINDTFNTTIGTVSETWANPVLGVSVQKHTTVMKSIRYVCESIIQNYPETQIILLTPSQTKDSSRLKLIADAIKECADVLSVEVIDVNARGGFYGKFESTTSQIFTTDGTHPNANMGVPILCQYIKREMLAKVNQRSESAYGYAAKIMEISAEYSGSSVAVGSDLASVKDFLTVTANHADGTTKTVHDYGLSGDLSTPGVATITVNYAGKVCNFNVSVSPTSAVISSITATYNQSATVYPTTSLSELRADLTVMANYDDGTTVEVVGYTLSGALEAGTATITVSYEGITTTFNVTVTEQTTERVWESETSSLYWNPVLDENNTGGSNGGVSSTTELWAANQISDKAFKAIEIQFFAVREGAAKFVVTEGASKDDKIINTLEFTTTGKGLVVKEVDFIIPAGGALWIAPTNTVSVVNLLIPGNTKPEEVTYQGLLNVQVDSQEVGGSITKVASALNYYAHYSLTGYKEA